MAACAHEDFMAKVDVTRLSHDEGGPINGYTLQATIKCTQCNLPFRFIGLAAGSHFAEPRVNTDATELRAPIEPADHPVFSPRASYTIPPKVTQ